MGRDETIQKRNVSMKLLKQILADVNTTEQERIKFLYQLNDTFLEEGIELDTYVYIKKYHAKFGIMPDLGRVAREPGLSNILLAIDAPDPLADTFEQFHAERRVRHIMGLSYQIRDAIETDQPLNPIIQELIKTSEVEQPRVLDSSDIEFLDFSSVAGKTIGIQRLDNELNGLLPGEIFTIVARPGNGKTVISSWLAYKHLLAGERVLYVSGEMTMKAIFSKIVAFHGHFNTQQFRRLNLLPENEVDIIKQAVADVRNLSGRASIMQRSFNGLSTNSIRAQVETFKPDFIFIDALYHLTPNVVSSDKYANVANVFNDLSNIGLHYNLPMIATSQLSRGASDKVVDLSHLAFSDTVGQISTLVATLQADMMQLGLYHMKTIKSREGNGNVEIDFVIDFDKSQIEEV